MWCGGGNPGSPSRRGRAAGVVRTACSRWRGAIGGRVLVLNASYEPINVCTVRRAAVLLLKRRAELLERSDERLHSERSAAASGRS